MSNVKRNSGEQIIWLDILRIWAVLLIVVLHSTLANEKNSLFGDFFVFFNDVFSCRMPLFFFVSGFLLFYTKIKNNSSYSIALKTRVPRVLYPYVFITVVVLVAKFLFSSYVERPVSISFFEFIGYFIYPHTSPWTNLWFLNVILIYFLLYPLIKKSLETWYGIAICLIIAVLLNIFFPKKTLILDLASVAVCFIYFYSGVVFAKFNLISLLKKHTLLIGGISAVAFVVSFLLKIGITQNLLGIILCTYLSLFCAEKFPAIFSSFRQYYYQIYLFGVFFQIPISILYHRTSNLILLIGLSILSVFIGIYAPVFVGKLIKKINWLPLLKATGF